MSFVLTCMIVYQWSCFNYLEMKIVFAPRRRLGPNLATTGETLSHVDMKFIPTFDIHFFNYSEFGESEPARRKDARGSQSCRT